MSERTALLLGNYRPTYILARSLKMRGYRIICGLDGYDRGAEMSRYVDAVWKHASYQSDLPRFQQDLTALLEKHPEISDIYPVAEPVILAIAKGQLELPETIRIGSMDPDLIKLCLDKQVLLEKAQELSIPVAPFAKTSDEADFYEKASAIGFPLVIRPLVSNQLLGNQKAITCTDEDDLKANDAVWQDAQFQLLIQRHVTGKRDNIYFAASGGEITRYLHAKITRTNREDGSGLAIEGKTIPPCPQLQAHSAALIRALGYNGIGCAQYLVDDDTGAIHFLELNPRIAGNHALPEQCGLSLGDQLIDLTEGEIKAAPALIGTSGLKYSWLSGELDAIRQAWRAGTMPAGQAFAKAVTAARAFIADDLDISFAPGDPMPGIITLLDSLPLIGGITRRRFDHPFFFKLFIRKDCLS